MAGFRFAKNLDGNSNSPTNLYFIGKNSVIFTVGDAVRINTSGFLDLAETTEGVFGVVAGVVDENGLAIEHDSGAPNTWTMSSTNQTVAKHQVAVIPAFGHYAWAADSDTTIEQASLGKYFALNATSDGVVTAGESFTVGNLDCQLIGLDPNGDGDTSTGLYRFVKTQIGQLAQPSAAA